jgi:hypothetical protein
MIDANRIASKLHQGAHPPPGPFVRLAGFDVLVLCAQERQPPAGSYPGVKVYSAPMDDSAWVPREMAMGAAQVVAKEIRAGKRVLVCCNMGINRSGLVNALALWLLTGKPGKECLWQVQERRPGALRNSAFAIFVGMLPARRRKMAA